MQLAKSPNWTRTTRLFRRYNDQYGHPAGDDCLRALAGAFTAGARGDQDVICRYGGEEFAAVIPGADQTVALQIAERIRAAVAALKPRPSA